MKRTYFPGITDIVVVTDPAEIRAISNDSRFDREFIGHGPIRNVRLLRKMLSIFSVNGRLFPTMLPRANPNRADPLNWSPWPNGSEGSELRRSSVCLCSRA
jgi:hypothetical protein